MNQHIYKSKSQIHLIDWERLSLSEKEQYVIYLTRQDHAQKYNLRNLLRDTNITLLTKAILQEKIHHGYNEYFMSPYDIGGYLMQKYNDKINRYVEAHPGYKRCDPYNTIIEKEYYHNHPEDLNRIYFYYRISSVAGNLNAYSKLIDLIKKYIPSRYKEIPLYKRQLLLLGGY